MARTVVGVLRGGPTSEYGYSLKTGAAMLEALPDEKYDVRDVFIDKQGTWHARGMPIEPARVLSQMDVALNALHGGIGEDGTIGRVLERAGVPYAGSRPQESALALNKARAREVFADAGIRVPQSVAFSLTDEIDTGTMAREVFARFGPPYVIKPANEGASNGLRIAYNFADLPDILGDVLDASGTALAEEYIRGDEATVGVIEGFRGEDLYALPPARVLYPRGAGALLSHHYDQGEVRHVVPSDFSDSQKQALAEAARAAHQALGLSHFSRADFILTKRGPYLLEVDALPHLYEGAAFSDKLNAVGSSVREFLEHVITLAKR